MDAMLNSSSSTRDKYDFWDYKDLQTLVRMLKDQDKTLPRNEPQVRTRASYISWLRALDLKNRSGDRKEEGAEGVKDQPEPERQVIVLDDDEEEDKAQPNPAKEVIVLDDDDDEEKAPVELLRQVIVIDDDEQEEEEDPRFDKVTGNLKEFTIFNKLPPELRIMIWKASPEPRVITLDAENRMGMPPMFSVCRESRQMGLEIHKCLRTDDCGIKIYFNPRIDTIFVRCVSLQKSQDPLSDEAAPHIKSLAVEFFSTFDLTIDPTLGPKKFTKFSKLENLALVRHPDKQWIAIARNRSRYTMAAPIQELRAISVEEDFDESNILNSGNLEKRWRDHLKQNLISWGGKSDIGPPEFRFLVGVPFRPIRRAPGS